MTWTDVDLSPINIRVYRQGDTYSGWTQDIIRVAQELRLMGATSVAIEKDGWQVRADFDSPTLLPEV